MQLALDRLSVFIYNNIVPRLYEKQFALEEFMKKIFQAKDIQEILGFHRQRYEYLATRIGITPGVEVVEGKGRAHLYSFKNALQFALAHSMGMMGLQPFEIRQALNEIEELDKAETLKAATGKTIEEFSQAVKERKLEQKKLGELPESIIEILVDSKTHFLYKQKSVGVYDPAVVLPDGYAMYRVFAKRGRALRGPFRPPIRYYTDENAIEELKALAIKMGQELVLYGYTVLRLDTIKSAVIGYARS
jgi:hypothetical protein